MSPSDFKSVTLSKAFNAFDISSSSESTSAPGDGGGDGGGEVPPGGPSANENWTGELDGAGGGDGAGSCLGTCGDGCTGAGVGVDADAACEDTAADNPDPEAEASDAWRHFFSSCHFNSALIIKASWLSIHS